MCDEGDRAGGASRAGEVLEMGLLYTSNCTFLLLLLKLLLLLLLLLFPPPLGPFCCGVGEVTGEVGRERDGDGVGDEGLGGIGEGSRDEGVGVVVGGEGKSVGSTIIISDMS